MRSAPPAAHDGPLKGWHVLAAVLAFFSIVIAIDVGFSIVAVRTFPGEDVKRSYLQGLRYNDTLAERAAQAKLGWRAELSVETRAGMPSAIVTLRDREGRLISTAEVRAIVRRPATDRADRTITFSPIADGAYAAALPGLADGAWDIRGIAEAHGQSFAFERRITWQASQTR